MKKIIITERNRDGAKIWLEHLYEKTYIIKSDKSYVLEYMRYIYDSVPNDALIYDFEYNDGRKGIYTAIDPSGGPYIALGDCVTADDGTQFKIGRIYNKENIGIVIDIL